MVLNHGGTLIIMALDGAGWCWMVLDGASKNKCMCIFCQHMTINEPSKIMLVLDHGGVESGWCWIMVLHQV